MVPVRMHTAESCACAVAINIDHPRDSNTDIRSTHINTHVYITNTGYNTHTGSQKNYEKKML